MIQVNYEIIKSHRKTIAIQIRPDCRVVVRAPYRMSKAAIKGFVNEKSSWNVTKSYGGKTVIDSISRNFIYVLQLICYNYT